MFTLRASRRGRPDNGGKEKRNREPRCTQRTLKTMRPLTRTKRSPKGAMAGQGSASVANIRQHFSPNPQVHIAKVSSEVCGAMFKFFWDPAILGVRCFVMCRVAPMSARLPSQSGKVNMCAASKSVRETSKRRSVGIGWIAWVNGQTNGFGAGQKVQIETPGGGAPPPSRQQGSEPEHSERVY